MKETVELYDGSNLLATVTEQDKWPDGVLQNATHVVIRTTMTRRAFDLEYGYRVAGIMKQSVRGHGVHMYEKGRSEVLTDLISRISIWPDNARAEKMVRKYGKDYGIETMYDV